MGADLIDPQPLLAAVGVPTPASVMRISGGWDTLLWRVEAGPDHYALRVFRPEQADTLRREAAVLAALHAGGLPVPHVFGATVTGVRPALLLSWCPGATVAEELRSHPWRIWRHATAMGRMHATIHAVPIGSLVQQLPRWTPKPEDLDPRLSTQLDDNATVSSSVLHLDYHPLNVLTDGQEITCVLDWANVAIGDRRADLARTITLLRLAPLPPHFPRLLQRPLRSLLECGWRHGYNEIERAHPFARLDPYLVWAGRMMERDLRPKLGRPGVWLTHRDLRAVHRWTERRQRTLR